MIADSKQHPEEEELVAFGLGKLGPEEAEQIAEHLNNCRACSETIVNLADDTFVGLVRIAPALRADANRESSPDQLAGLDVDATLAAGVGLTAGGVAPTDLPAEIRQHPRYEIMELIGRGGMGDVYKAQHKVMNRVVALKVIKPELVRNNAAVERFRREVQAAASLRHPNIVTAHDAEQAGNLHFLVMEYVNGDNLDKIIRRDGPLSVQQACDFIRQAAEGLAHAHDMGMVHRDIKPHNLMVEQQTGTIIGSATVVKILDFGLANFANEVAAEELDPAQREIIAPGASIMRQLTKMGTMMGTPDYIAPEQAADAHKADIRADIYSLGCTFYTMLTGKVPFGEGSVLEKIKAHSQQAAPPVSDFRDDVPSEVETVLRKMIAKDPADRYQTPAEVAEALRRAGSVSSLEPTGASEKAERKHPAHGGRSPRWPLTTALVGLMLLPLLAAAIVFYVQLGRTTLKFEIEDPDLEVQFAGQTLTVNNDGKPFRITPGDEQHMIVDGGGLRGQMASFTLNKGQKVTLRVLVVDGNPGIIARGGNVQLKQQPIYTPSEVEQPPPSASEVESLLADAVLAMNFSPESFYQQDGKTYVRDMSGNNHDALLVGGRHIGGGQAGGAVELDGSHRSRPVAAEHEEEGSKSTWPDDFDGLHVNDGLIASGKPFTVAGWIWLDWTVDEKQPSAELFSNWNPSGKDGLAAAVGRVEHYFLMKQHFPPQGLKKGEEGWTSTWGPFDYNDKPANLGFAQRRWGFVAYGRDAQGRMWFTADGKTTETQSKAVGNSKVPGECLFGRDLVGRIDELVVFDRALTAAELNILYRHGRVGQSLALPKGASSQKLLVIGMNEENGMLFEGRLVAPAELSRLLRDALAKDPNRVVSIDMPNKKPLIAAHVGQFEQIARTAGAKHITRPAWSEIRIRFDIINGSAQILDIKGPGYSASGFAESYLPNIREVIARNPGLPVLLDIGEGVDLSDDQTAEGFDEVRRVAEAAGAEVRLSRPLPGAKAIGTIKSLTALAASALRKKVLAGTEDGTVACWDLDSGEKVWEQGGETHFSKITALAMADGYDWCASGEQSGRIVLRSLISGRLLHTLSHGDPLAALVMSSDPRTMLSAGLKHPSKDDNSDYDKSRWILRVLTWDTEAGEHFHEFEVELPAKVEGDIKANHLVVVDPTISRFPSPALVFVAIEGASEGWLYASADKECKDPLAHVKVDGAVIRCAAFSRDDAKLVVGDDQGGMHVIDLKDGYKQSTLNMTGKAAVRSILWLADNERLLTHDENGDVEIWHAEQVHQLHIGRAPFQTQWAATGGESVVAAIPFARGDTFSIYAWRPPSAHANLVLCHL